MSNDDDAKMLTFEQHAKILGTARFFVRAMVRKFNWPKLQEMTRTAFLAALEATKQHQAKR